MNFNSHYVDSILLCLVYFSTFIIQNKCQLTFPALTFDQKIHALLNIPGKIQKGVETIEGSIAVACPAETPEEVAFDSNTFSRNSLFVKWAHTGLIDLNKVPNEICKRRYKMSISYHKLPAEFLFGYEVYNEELKFTGIESKNYANFDFIANAFSWAFSPNNTKKPKLELAKDRPLNFVWILIFRLKFDDKKRRLKQAIYTVSKSAETGITCQDYDLGKEYYDKKKINLNSLYENQSQIFEDVAMPNYINELQKPACEPGNQCLSKWSLIPPEEFRFRYPEPESISCADLATVPIWTSIAKETLAKLDIFLYALAKILHRDLQVTSSIHGKLVMPKNAGFEKTKKIKLGKKGGISVPNVIYKTIKYQVPLSDEKDDQGRVLLTTKAIIIVLHNDPYFEAKDAFCEKPKCKDWGWGEISASNYIFCCPRNENTFKNLGLKYDKDEIEVLDLTNIPIYDSHSKTTTFKNIVKDVVDKMKKLIAGEKDSKDDHVGKNDHFYDSENDENKVETTNEQGEVMSRTTSSNSSGSGEKEEEDINENPKSK